MKKFFSLIAAVLFAGSMMATTVSQTVENLAAAKSWENGVVVTPFALDDVITISTTATDANTGKYYTNGQQIRLYQTGAASLTVTAAEGATISSITLTYASQNGGILVEAASETAVSFENVQSATFTIGNSGDATNGQVRITAIAVTYDGGDVPPVEETCNWDEIEFLGNGSGNEAYTNRFKVCAGDPAPTSIVNIQAPAWADEPGIYVAFPSAAFGAISLDEAQYAIDGAGMVLYVSAFLYDAETEVTVVCQDVTYTLTIKNANPETAPVELISCADVYGLADNAEVNLNPVVVTYSNGANVWVKDEAGSMLIYLPNGVTNEFVAGNILSGVAGVKATFKGLVEVKPSADQFAAIEAVAGEAPAPVEMAAVADADVNKYIILKGVTAEGAFAEGTASNLNITLGEATYVLRNNFKNAFTFEAGKAYDVVALVSYYNALQLYFVSATESGETPVETMNYYVVGSMTSWAANANYKLVANPENEGEYMGEFTFAANDQFKVAYSNGSTIEDSNWFPGGMDNNYVITEAGDYNVYFRPEGGVEGWYEGFFNVIKKETPIVEAITCSAVYEMAKNDVVELLNDVVVTFANGKNVWVKDETASMLIFLPAASEAFSAGDVLSGIAGVVDIYNGVHEVKPSADQVAAIVATAGEAPAAEAVAAVAATDVNKYIVMENVAAEGVFAEGTASNLTINGVTVRNNFKNGYTFEAGKTYNIYGVVTLYQNNPQVYFITANESGVAPVPVAEYYIAGSMNG